MKNCWLNNNLKKKKKFKIKINKLKVHMFGIINKRPCELVNPAITKKKKKIFFLLKLVSPCNAPK
jgi:hypothetical protein